MRRVKPRRARQRSTYRGRRLNHLELHPLCQIAIAAHGFDEAEVVAAFRAAAAPDGWRFFVHRGVPIPRATTIHHRNKGREDRLNDERWWMSASLEWHDIVETHKFTARLEGFLLPLEADADGLSPNGARALETPDFMRGRASAGESALLQATTN